MVDDALDILPEVVVRVAGGGCVAAENFIEVCDNSFVVGTDQDRGSGVFDNMSDGTEFGSVGTLNVGVQGLAVISGGARGNVDAPPRMGKQWVEGVEGGAVGKDLNITIAIDLLPYKVGNRLVDALIGAGQAAKDGISAVFDARHGVVQVGVVGAYTRDIEGAIVTNLLELVRAPETFLREGFVFEFVVLLVIRLP